jgi:hypothetical protein
MDNNMAGGLISNVLTLGFRKTVYSLGNNLRGSVTVDCTKGDVQTGTVTDACLLDFSKWAPADTEGTVEVILKVSAGQKIMLPSNVVDGVSTIAGYDTTNSWVIVPNGVTRLHWAFSSIDCGTTIEIAPVDEPRIAKQIKWGTPYKNGSVYGQVGDTAGDIMLNSTHLYLCVEAWNGTTSKWSQTVLGSTSW